MNVTTAEIDTIYKIIEPLLGHKAWNVRLGVGSFITMEFGDPVTSSRGTIFGDWHLWIYCCGWFLENPNDTYVGSEDPREILRQRIIVLEGRSLENVIISPIAFETNFIFDNSLTLHTFPLNFHDPCDYWKLYTPQRRVLILGPAPKWSYELSAG
ncbi:MAG TPA: hypothetical protein VLM80_07010 [Anaerolineales bacterium]|nr:hypothetical protein [Anaerolineales bacterium]